MTTEPVKTDTTPLTPADGVVPPVVATPVAKEEPKAKEEVIDLKETPAQVETPKEGEPAPKEEAQTDEEKAAAEAAAAEEAAREKEATPLDATVWGDTGSDVGNSVLTLLQNADVSTDEAKALMYDAVVEGDVSKIDQSALEAKVGKNKANLILAGVKGFIAESTEKNAAINEVVFTEAGDKATWDKMIDWAKASNTDLTEYAAMIDNGGAQARFAVGEIRGLYNADPKNTTLTASKRAEPSAVAAPALKPMTRSEFTAAIDAAHAAGDQRAVDAAKAARQLGRKQGI